MVINYLKKYLVSLFVSSFLFASCVNQDYDLSKDIDLNIHVGGNALALPVGNTDSIKLSKIIKVDESDVLHLNAGGEYSLLKEDVVSPVNVSVPTTTPISIKSITWQSTNLYTIAGMPTRVLPRSETMNLVVPETSWNLTINHEDIPSEVKSIKTITPQNGGVDATITLTLTGVTSDVDYDFKDLELVFPDFIVSSQLSNHKMLLNGSLNQGLTKVIPIKITSFDFSNESGGALAINNKTLNISKLITFSGAIIASGLNASTVKGDVKLSATVQVNPVIMSEVEGKVDPSINIDIKPISLDIPDFLEDDAVTMDVENPMIRLTVTNETAIPIVISGLLKGFRDGNQQSEVVVEGTEANPITIDASGTTIICLSRTGKGGPAGSKNYQIANLNDLVERIPNHIRFIMNARADQTSMHKIQLGRSYNIGLNYAVEVPFRFGSGLAIVYNDSIDDFNEDIKDLDVKALKVTTTVENNIPLDLKLEATPVGVNKSAGALSGLSVKVTGDIRSCDADGNKQESPLTIEVIETTSGAIKKLDGLLLKVTAKSTETVNGMPLKENQYIRLKNIKASASSGFDVDLNDK